MSKLLVVGINPSSGKPRRHSAINRLESWINDLGVHHYSFANVIPDPGEYKISMVDLDYVKSFCKGHDRVVALGGFVSQSLKRAGVEHYAMPYPSPLNRKLNDKNYEKRCISDCMQRLKN